MPGAGFAGGDATRRAPSLTTLPIGAQGPLFQTMAACASRLDKGEALCLKSAALASASPELGDAV